MAEQTIDKRRQFRDESYAEWTDPLLTAAYRTWGEHEAHWSAALTDAMVDRARLCAGHHVLDVGAGHGEPALAIATAVGPSGHVTASDLGPGLMEVGAARARERGIDNVTWRVADAHELPFPDGTFDIVTSKLAAMYFGDKPTAFAELHRVLRPGGRAVLGVWGTPESPTFDLLVGTLLRHVELPDDDPAAPNPFAYAEPGSLAAQMTAAGFGEAREDRLELDTRFPGTPEEYWQWFVDTAPCFAELFASLGSRLADLRAEVVDRASAHQRGDEIVVPVEVVVGTATAA